jgi:hypothetical protein
MPGIPVKGIETYLYKIAQKKQSRLDGGFLLGHRKIDAYLVIYFIPKGM